MQQQKTVRPKWGLWGRLWSFIKPYRGWIVLSFTSVILAATAVLWMGQAIRGLIDQGFHQDNAAGFQYSILLLIGLVVLLAIASFTRSYTTSLLSEKTALSLRHAIFARVLRLAPSAFETTKVADIQMRLTHDISLVQMVIGSTGTMALRNILMIIGGILFLVMTSPYLTGLFLLVVPLVVGPLSIVGRRMRKISKQAQDYLANISGYVDEMVSHLKLVQAYTYEKQASQTFDQQLNTFFQTTRKRLLYQAFLGCLIILLVFSAVIGLLWHGGAQVIQGNLTAGTLVSFIFYAIIVASSIGSIGEFWGHVQHASGALERIMGVFKIPVHHPDQKPVVTKQKSTGRIDFQRISFSYPSRSHQWAVHEFQAVAEPGQKIAITGPSGAGKSTLFHLLLRFYDSQQGHILLDGTNINHYNVHILRQQMALVPQDPVVFSGTIIENILYGAPEAPSVMVNKAIRDAALDEFVSRLPQGYETLVGEKGIRLSGGQKQRIAIARALIRQPKILLLDEATSALDNYHENIIQQALDGLMMRCTTLVIAHRLSTVVNADQIWVMDKGTLLAVGRHEELISYSPFYRDMVESQFALHSKNDRLVQDNKGYL